MVVRLTAEAILFDCDGVLVDSADAIARIWTEWAEQRLLDPEVVLRVSQGRQTIDTVRNFVAPNEVEPAVEELTKLEIQYASQIRPVPGVLQLVSHLPTQRWALVTSGSSLVARLRLSAARIRPPRVMVTADDACLGKPDPAPYLMAARRLHVPLSQCVVFEDSVPGVESARTGGATVVGVLTSHPMQELLADYCVDDFNDVIVYAARGPMTVLLDSRSAAV